MIKAQPIISNSYFPEIGDKLALAVASENTTKQISITPSDENQIWSYGFLDSVDTSIELYEAPSSAIKQDFPEADIISTLEGQETVFNKTQDRFEIIGLKNFRFQNLTINTLIKSDNPVLVRRADMTYISVNNNRSTSVTTLSPAQFPDSLIHKLPIRPDSVRITIVDTRQDYADAWGSLTIPKATYTVLRVRCIEIIEQKIEIKINNTWSDVTPQYFKGNPNPQDTLINYQFWAEGIKTPILRLTLKSDYTISKAEYRIEPPQTVAIAGTVRFWTGTPMPNTVIKIGKDSTFTDINGQFRFPNIEIGKNLDVSIYKKDNYENGIDGADIVLLRRHIIGITDFNSPNKFFAGDIDDNGDIDALDYLFIKRLVIGFIDAFPQTSAWRFALSSTAQNSGFPNQVKDIFPLQKTFSTPLSNFDFVGFKKGDVNGSADVGN